MLSFAATYRRWCIKTGWVTRSIVQTSAAPRPKGQGVPWAERVHGLTDIKRHAFAALDQVGCSCGHVIGAKQHGLGAAKGSGDPAQRAKCTFWGVYLTCPAVSFFKKVPSMQASLRMIVGAVAFATGDVLTYNMMANSWARNGNGSMHLMKHWRRWWCQALRLSRQASCLRAVRCFCGLLDGCEITNFAKDI